MLAGALDFDLAIADANVITRGIDDCRTGEHATITHAEARTMPRTLHNIALERPFIQWAACMGTGR